MSKRTGGGSPQAVAKSKPTAARTATVTSSKPASAKAKASVKSGAQQSLPLNDVAALQNIRRANLHVLTARKGSKARLSAVMSISASNLDNRLYGQKRMDDAEASRFTERLGLPTAWLDIPRSVTDIPESQLGCRCGVEVKSSLIGSAVACSALPLKAEWPQRSGGLMGFEFSDR